MLRFFRIKTNKKGMMENPPEHFFLPNRNMMMGSQNYPPPRLINIMKIALLVVQCEY